MPVGNNFANDANRAKDANYDWRTIAIIRIICNKYSL